MNAFRMDQKSGVLSTRSQLDREKASHYSIIVNAIDQASPVSERRTATYLLPISNYLINLFFSNCVKLLNYSKHFFQCYGKCTHFR